MAKHFLKIDDFPPLSFNEAKVLVSLGTWERQASDIARILPLHRRSISDILLMLQAKGLIKCSKYGYFSGFSTLELEKIALWIQENAIKTVETPSKS